MQYAGAVKFMHWSMGGAVLGCFGFVQLAMNVDIKTKDENQAANKKLKTNYVSRFLPAFCSLSTRPLTTRFLPLSTRSLPASCSLSTQFHISISFLLT
jgi:hypothetical protein